MAVAIRTDEAIQRDVVDSLYWDDRVDSSKVGVTVDDGHVTLTGKLTSYAAKLAAAEDARLISGVRGVENQIAVEFVRTVPSDSEIVSNITDTLDWDTDLFAFDIDADVSGGWVTLEGSVDTYWKRAKAEDLVAQIRGVIGATNKIAVVPTQKYSDERLADKVIDAIERSVNVDINSINVVVEDGKITLTGTVPAWSAKTAAYDAARYTLGVKDVDNQIAVSYV